MMVRKRTKFPDCAKRICQYQRITRDGMFSCYRCGLSIPRAMRAECPYYDLYWRIRSASAMIAMVETAQDVEHCKKLAGMALTKLGGGI